jgi:hypothetical protein
MNRYNLPSSYELTTFDQLVDIANQIGNIQIPLIRNRKILYDRIKLQCQTTPTRSSIQQLPVATKPKPKSSNLLYMEERTKVVLATAIATETKTKRQMRTRYYQTSDGKHIESPVTVELEWLSVNLAKQCTLVEYKPAKVDYRVLVPDNKVHWVNTIEKVN